MTSTVLMLAKVGLVACVVLLASLASRRFGHRVGGLLAGLPMIAAPITGLLLTEVAPERVRSVCLATLVCQPALIAYLVTYAHAAARWRWPVCLLLSLAVFGALGAALLQLPLPPWASMALAVAAPMLGRRLMPRVAGSHAAAAAVPGIELLCRVLVAMAVASGVLWGAGHLGAGLAGLLLAAPITGVVLPSFTLPRHGAQATAALLVGFLRGQAGFVAFFVVMVLALPGLPGSLAWGLALAASAWVPWSLGRLRR